MLDVKREHVDQTHHVPDSRQPCRVNARAAANIEHTRRRRGQRLLKQFKRPYQFEPVVAPSQAIPLDTGRVVTKERLVHGGILPSGPRLGQHSGVSPEDRRDGGTNLPV